MNRSCLHGGFKSPNGSNVLIQSVFHSFVPNRRVPLTCFGLLLLFTSDTLDWLTTGC